MQDCVRSVELKLGAAHQAKRALMFVVLPVSRGTDDDDLAAEEGSAGVVPLPVFRHENLVDGVRAKRPRRTGKAQAVTLPVGRERIAKSRFLEQARRQREFLAALPDAVLHRPAILGVTNHPVGVRPEIIEADARVVRRTLRNERRRGHAECGRLAVEVIGDVRGDHDAITVPGQAFAKGIVLQRWLWKGQVEGHRACPGTDQPIQDQSIDFPRPRPFVNHEIQRAAGVVVRGAEVEKPLQVGCFEIG